MKILISFLALLFTTLGFSQSSSIKGIAVKETPKVENITLTLTVDSAAEIKSSFQLQDLNEILQISSDNESLSFKIICNGKSMSNGKKSHVSYKVEGNSNDKEDFFKSVEIIRAAAIKYYNNKN